MQKYTLITNSTDLKIIDSFYFAKDSEDGKTITGMYKSNPISCSYKDIVKTSENILDLLEINDMVGVALPNTDFGDPNTYETYMTIFDIKTIQQWIAQGLNIVSIYKQNKKKNFIRLAEKVFGAWRTI